MTAELLENRDVLFKVSDTGIGIAPENHDTIFKEFGQVDNLLQNRYRGTGLGLPLCRNLAMLLGGRIWLESELGKGSTFFVNLPPVYVGEAAQQDDFVMPAAPEFHRTPILFLEDNAETANVLESHLRGSEFQPILSPTVAQSEVWASRHAPAAVVADIYLGDEKSWDFITRLRERSPELPIIITSVHNESAGAISKGANLFLLKPIEREVLLRELRRLTAHSGTKRLLLVDDNEVARYILRDLLDQPWLDIREASSGSEALTMLNESLPDALILDLLMPDISGFEILRQLRAQQTTRALPVLIYTSKVLSDSEKTQLNSWQAKIIRKEDVSTRLSAQPFLDWVKSIGLANEADARDQNA